MLPLPKILTLPGALALLFPKASPGKATDWPEGMLIKLFYGVAGWSMLGAPNWSQAKVDLPKIDLPTIEQAANLPATSNFTTNSGVLVRCPANLQVVNIRQSAGLSNVLSQVKCGDRVTITGNDRPVLNGETWVPVQHKGVKGWATARYLAL